MQDETLKNSLTYRICMALAVIGLIVLITTTAINWVYIQGMISDCTYEVQHTEDGPICLKLRDSQRLMRNYSMLGVGMMFFFSTAGWLYERRRKIRKNPGV